MCGVISMGLSIKLVGSVAVVGWRWRLLQNVGRNNQKVRDHLGDLVVDRRMKSSSPESSSVPGSQANIIHFSAASVYVHRCFVLGTALMPHTIAVQIISLFYKGAPFNMFCQRESACIFLRLSWPGSILRDSRFLQRCWWKPKSCGVWQRVDC